MSEATVDRRHVRIKITVKIGIKGNGMVQRVGGNMAVVRGQLLEQGDRQYDLMRHVQAHHRERKTGAKNAVCGMRVVPDIGLGHRRYVTGLQHCAAHDDHGAQKLRQLRLDLQRNDSVEVAAREGVMKRKNAVCIYIKRKERYV